MGGSRRVALEEECEDERRDNARARIERGADSHHLARVRVGREQVIRTLTYQRGERESTWRSGRSRWRTAPICPGGASSARSGLTTPVAKPGPRTPSTSENHMHVSDSGLSSVTRVHTRLVTHATSPATAPIGASPNLRTGVCGGGGGQQSWRWGRSNGGAGDGTSW